MSKSTVLSDYMNLSDWLFELLHRIALLAGVIFLAVKTQNLALIILSICCYPALSFWVGASVARGVGSMVYFDKIWKKSHSFGYALFYVIVSAITLGIAIGVIWIVRSALSVFVLTPSGAYRLRLL